jgi:hypothetical protein
MRAHLQPPREMNIHTRLDHNTIPYFCTKRPQQSALQRRRPRQSAQKKYDLRQIPDRLEPSWATTIKASRCIKQIQPHPRHADIFFIWI